MKCDLPKLLLNLMLLACIIFICRPLFAGNVMFHGKTAAIDLSDLETYSEDKLTEARIKSICTEIIDRYHDRGYTAFYIDKAVHRKDGTLDIFFNESVVSSIVTDSESGEYKDIANKLFIVGDPFNEFVLKDNISSLKKKFMLRELSTTVTREQDGTILLTVHAERIKYTAGLSFEYDSLRGIIAGVTAGYYGKSFYGGISAASSFGQEEISISEGGIELKEHNTGSGFASSIKFMTRDDALDDKCSAVFETKRVDANAGWFTVHGMFMFSVNAGAGFVRLQDYYLDGNTQQYYLHLTALFDDRTFHLDRNDYFIFKADIDTGWDTLFESFFTDCNMSIKTSIRLTRGFYMVLEGESFFSSPDKRFFNEYVFSGLLSFRERDYISSPWINSAGIGLTWELMKYHVYLTPELRGGFFDDGGEFRGTGCAGASLSWHSAFFNADLMLMKDLSGSGDVVYSFMTEADF